MGLTVRELVIKWGFDVDNAPAKKLQRDIDKIKSSAMAIGTIIAAAGIKIGFVLREAGKKEQTRIAFETLLGSVEKADKTIRELYDFARTTPFEIPQVEQAAKKLLAFNFSAENLIKTLTILGNISSIVGRDKLPFLMKALADVRGEGVLLRREEQQFINAGFGIIQELERMTGKSTKELRDMMRARQLSFAMVMEALEQATLRGGRFTNAMIKQSKTLFGIMSNLFDFMIITVRQAGEKLLPEVKKIALGVLAWAEANSELIETNIIKFFRTLTQILKDTIFFLRDIARVLSPIIRSMGGLNVVVRRLFKLLLAITALRFATLIGNTVLTLSQMTMTTLKLVRAVGFLRTAVIGLKLAMGTLIGLGVIAFLLVLEDIFRGLVLQQDSFTKRIIDNWERIKERLSEMIRFFSVFKELFVAIGQEMERMFAPIFLAAKVLGAIRRFGAAGEMVTSSARFPGRGAGGGGDISNVSVNSPITVNVPPNTPPESVGGAVKDGIKDSFDTLFRNAQNANRLNFVY